MTTKLLIEEKYPLDIPMTLIEYLKSYAPEIYFDLEMSMSQRFENFKKQCPDLGSTIKLEIGK